MARAPRGPGGRWRASRSAPLDLSGTLGNLLRSTLEQVGAMRDAVERQTRTSRGRLDDVMLQRKRRDSLARLGERVHELSLQARLDEVADDGEVAALLAEVEAIEDQMDGPAAPEEREAVSSASYRAPRASRSEDVRVWRPVMPEHEPDHGQEVEDAVTSTSGHGQARPARDERVPWESVTPAEPRERPRRGRARDAGRDPGRGGITFVADEADAGDDDLAEYMHPDDLRRRDGD